MRLGHDGVRRRAVGPTLDHDRHVARPARARAAAAPDGDVPVLRAPGLRARPGRRLRLQAQAEREGRGGRRDRPARHAQVDRERRAAGGGGARRPAGGRLEDHARHRPVRRRGDDPDAGRTGDERAGASEAPGDSVQKATARTSTGCSRRCAATPSSSSAATGR